jgi:hypothetical protein
LHWKAHTKPEANTKIFAEYLRMMFASHFNDNEWFAEEIGDHESDYLLIACPGLIEVASHMTVLTSFNDCR